MDIVLLVVATLFLVGGWRARRRAQLAEQRLSRFLNGLSTALFGCAGAVTLVAATALLWFNNRPLPEPVHTELFDGVTYTREIRSSPRPLVIHVVRIDLDTPGVSFLVTPGDPAEELPLRARSTSGFLEEFDLQVAVNGAFFHPSYSFSPWNYYPRAGDPVDVNGLASADGVIYANAFRNYPTLYLSETNEAQFNAPPPGPFNAISGNTLFVNNGQFRGRVRRNAVRHPRTAVAVDEPGETLMLIVVDGRQPNYSEGVTMAELGEIVIGFGGYTALNLDGGGSSTLVVEGEDGQPLQLNSPIDNSIPGRERPVGNHLGLYARPLSP